MTQEQIELLKSYLYYQRKTKQAALTPNELHRVTQIKTALIDHNIDIEHVLAAREEYMQQAQHNAEATQTVFNTEKVRLSGFLVPLTFNGMLATEFLLVPKAISCVHTPPPVRNQVVVVKANALFSLDSLYTPVWVEGTMMTHHKEHTVRLSDGIAQISSSYELTNASIQKYYRTQAD
nr:DUF3299 domain-containing protein [Shewanella gelidimarina]